MTELLIALALTYGTTQQRAEQIATVAEWAAKRHDAAVWFPKLETDVARERMARLLVVWSFYESSFVPEAIGDGGKACGLLQVHANAKRCRELTRSAYEGMDAGATMLDGLIATCGSLRSALGAYATGQCGGAPALVERRCKEAGGC